MHFDLSPPYVPSGICCPTKGMVQTLFELTHLSVIVEYIGIWCPTKDLVVKLKHAVGLKWSSPSVLSVQLEYGALQN